jgi:hypothetical protein
MLGPKDSEVMNNTIIDHIYDAETHVPSIFSGPQCIQNVRLLMAAGKGSEALDQFLSIGESLALWSSFDVDNNPVLDAICLPIELSSLTDTQLLTYASWMHHIQMQLTLRIKPWSTDREMALRITGLVAEFVKHINNGNFERVKMSGYFTVIETLLKQTR